MANVRGAQYQDIPLNITGSTKFGRYPEISAEQTYNMINSDGWLVPFAGYKRVAVVSPAGTGRGIYTSTRLNKMFAVIDNRIYSFDDSLTKTFIGTIPTSSGDVFITENNNSTLPTSGEVVFSDQKNLYIYQNSDNSLTTRLGGTAVGSLGFTPGYLTYQNGRVISPDTASNQWRLSDPNQASALANWGSASTDIGLIQTKPDKAKACVRFPGRGNLLLVFGENVTEQWYDVGKQLFPYQRSQSINLDYGCLNPATIADSENIVCWLAVNEKSGPTIVYTDGDKIQHISTDGIDFKLAELTNPSNSYGFMFKQYGHLFYVITFVDDNLTYAYDFKDKKFYTLSDENLNYFVAKRVAFFNDQYYFVSINDGNLYQMGADFTSYDYGDVAHEIPRIRILPTIERPQQDYFVAGYTGFRIEQGITSNTQRVDFSVSKDGGTTFSNIVSKTLNLTGHRKNRLMFWDLGMSNTLTQQFRFVGFDRFLATDGVTGIRQ